MSADVPLRLSRLQQHHRNTADHFSTRLPSRANPELAGTVAVQWTIGSDGQVARASVASATPETLLETDLDACLVQGVKTWVFPAPKAGEVQVIYPFVFATE